MVRSSLIAACGGSETTSSTHDNQDGASGSSGTGQDAGAGSAGANGASGAAGASGSAGMESGTGNVRSPRRCGHGVPCAAGSECAVTYIESGLDCKCDASGHFFCDAWAGGGAPSQVQCPRPTGCSGSGGSGGTDGGSCELSNGYCTKTCVCPSGTCTTDCSGTGPAASEGVLCDPSYCTGSNYRCNVKDGSCDYKVECTIGSTTADAARDRPLRLSKTPQTTRT